MGASLDIIKCFGGDEEQFVRPTFAYRVGQSGVYTEEEDIPDEDLIYLQNHKLNNLSKVKVETSSLYI